jgi:hypothetical protein
MVVQVVSWPLVADHDVMSICLPSADAGDLRLQITNNGAYDSSSGCGSFNTYKVRHMHLLACLKPHLCTHQQHMHLLGLTSQLQFCEAACFCNIKALEHAGVAHHCHCIVPVSYYSASCGILLAVQFELLANGECWGSVNNLMVNGQKHFPVYTTNYDSTGKK